MIDYSAFIPLLPLLGFLALGLGGKYLKSEKLIGSIASSAVGLSFLLSLKLLIDILSGSASPREVSVFNWIAAGNFSVNVSYQVDQLSITFALIITGVGFLIHLYSMGYMHGDRSYYRFFAYLNLFIFMMLNLVLSSNFLLTFLGWEGVGLCSYLLIGFWYDRKFEGTRIRWTGDAANKAFIVNRIGDFGFIIAMFLVFGLFGSLEYSTIAEMANQNASSLYAGASVTAITLLMFLGCTGKSAQIPLAVWLPDAMAGPTPVSALIHAATMVTAGIFLIARNATLFALSPTTMNVVAIIGILTAFFAATVGLVQNDIKKVLAYSTVSQLGFMFAALGVGAFTAGVFHVMTHAFFKGLLFLAAGSVIHGMHEEQNIKKMGNLKRYMPTTHWTFLVATLAISGIPFFSGFFSKDEILWMTYSNGSPWLWIILLLTAFMTAFYMFRLLYLTFYGSERFNTAHTKPHESPKVMTVPLVVLAVLSAIGGLVGVPHALGGFLGEHSNLLESWLGPVFANANEIIKFNHTPHEHSLTLEYLLMGVSVIAAISAILIAKKWYSDPQWNTPRRLAKSFNPIYRLLLGKYKLDEFYFAVIIDPIYKLSHSFLWKFFDIGIIDGLVHTIAKSTQGTGQLVRRIQSGVAQNYAVIMTAGIVAIIALLLSL